MRKKFLSLFLCLAMAAGLLAPGMVSRAEEEPDFRWNEIPVVGNTVSETLEAGKEAVFTMKVMNTSDEALTLGGINVLYDREGEDPVKWCNFPEEMYGFKVLTACNEAGEELVVSADDDKTTEIIDAGETTQYMVRLTLPDDFQAEGLKENAYLHFIVSLYGTKSTAYHIVMNEFDLDALCVSVTPTGSVSAGKEAVFEVQAVNLSDEPVATDRLFCDYWLYAFNESCLSNRFGKIEDENGAVSTETGCLKLGDGYTIEPDSAAKFTITGTMPKKWNAESYLAVEFDVGEDETFVASAGYGPERWEHKHAYETKTVKATLKKNGKITKTCPGCGDQKTTTIYRPKTIKLSKTSFTYNGKVQKPKVTVKDAKGNTIGSKNYTVTYSKGCKKAGKYTVTVKFKGNYSGTKKLYFTIKKK